MSETTENPIREAIADAIREHEVILFMKGTPERPACGFSARTVAALDAIGKEFAAVDIVASARYAYLYYTPEQKHWVEPLKVAITAKAE